MITCTVCHQEKEDFAFSRLAPDSDTRHRVCRRCVAAGAQERGGEGPGFVYLMYCPLVQLHKIGITRNVSTRLASLNAIPGVDVVLIHSVYVAHMRQTEAELHRQAAGVHCRGDWFRLDGADVERIIEAMNRVRMQ